ncbi:hypothetical protein PFISCL1PPCAC_2575, partial [Pristionchus fissidentatus]
RFMLILGHFLPIFCFVDYSNGESSEEEIPTILSWTPFFGSHVNHQWFQERLSDEKCPKQCRFVPRSDELNHSITDYDGVIFHTRDVSLSDLPKSRKSDQLYLLFSLEAPGNRAEGTLQKFPPFYFNRTVGYSSLNHYVFDYDRLADANLTKDAVKAKNQSILAVISNCHTASGRESLMKVLWAQMDITLRGRCYEKSVSGDELENLIKTHRFVIAMENTACMEYVTEKAFRYKSLIVPIVLSRELVKDVLPADSFIAVDDFDDVTELKDRISTLQRNDDEYMKYFAWMDREEDQGMRFKGICKLCTDLHNRRLLVHFSLPQAVFPDARLCETGIVDRLLKGQKKKDWDQVIFKGGVVTLILLVVVLLCYFWPLFCRR